MLAHNKKLVLILTGLFLLVSAISAGAGFAVGTRFRAGPDPDFFFESYSSEPTGLRVDYFAMQGCPHCEKFDPVWEAVSASAPGDGMQRWDVKTEEGRKRARDAGVSAFPHVQKTAADGTVEVFNGKRTEGALAEFVRQ